MKLGHKISHYVLSILFLLFAIVQWNDPDPYLWVALYLVIAAIPLFHLKQNLNTFLLGALAFILLLISATYVPAIAEWVGEGMPTITDSMKAESLHIELVRESLGLFLSLGIVIYYYLKSKR